jgi:tRNA pseudouridine55 synthase
VLGNLTRLAQFYTASEKDYEGMIRFGYSTDTYDAEGEATSPKVDIQVSLEELKVRIGRFRGDIEQMPPPFSAKKIQGVPAYKLARKQKNVPLKSVAVHVKSLEICSVEGACARFTASVGSGTYMRSIAHDLGQEMGCGAHLESLRRTRVAEFGIDDSHRLEELEPVAKQEALEELFVHPRKLLPHLPGVTANDESAAKIRNGRAVNLPELSKAKLVKVFYGQRELICIATRVAGTLFQPKIVLAEPAPQLLYRG